MRKKWKSICSLPWDVETSLVVLWILLLVVVSVTNVVSAKVENQNDISVTTDTSLDILDGLDGGGALHQQLEYESRIVENQNIEPVFVELPTISTATKSRNTTSSNGRRLDQFDKIVGGYLTDAQEFPFFVQGMGCGASLVAQDVVLTAAHCNVPGIFDDQVLVGSYQYNSTSNGMAQWRRIVSNSKVVHPNFYDFLGSSSYDLMLFKIEAVTLPNLMVAPITLNSDDAVPSPGEALTVIGYGATLEGANMSQSLLKVIVNAVDSTTCAQWYQAIGTYLHDASEFCAAAPGKDSCQGDSGGPIFILDSSGNSYSWRQVGLVSHGAGCARPEYPGIYAKISGSISWLQETICLLSDFPSSLPFPCESPPTFAPTHLPTYAPTMAPTTARPTASFLASSTADAPIYYNVTTMMATTEAPTVVIPASLESGGTAYIVEVRYDLRPFDYSWSIRDVSDPTKRRDALVARVDKGQVRLPYHLLTQPLDLIPGRSYKVTAQDRSEDDSLQRGSIKIFKLVGVNDATNTNDNNNNYQKIQVMRIAGKYRRIAVSFVA